jgi:SP family general alpha glucoside:H+ symporter-like MFS transporter
LASSLPITLTSTITMTEKIFTKAEDDIVRDMGMDAVRDAAAADASEHSMTLRQAFNSHRKAIFWSMALSGA